MTRLPKQGKAAALAAYFAKGGKITRLPPANVVGSQYDELHIPYSAAPGLSWLKERNIKIRRG